MKNDQDPRLFLLGGIAGIAGTLCYVLAIVAPLGQRATFSLAMAWPILSIVFVFALFRFIGQERQSSTNQLAFLFACLAFTLVAAMMSAQLSVRAGIQDYAQSAAANEQEVLKVVRRSVRLVDMGLDVAWDLFVGTSLIFLSFALRRDSRFGIWWMVPSFLLGSVLIGLNVETFPWPPNTRGLFDVGPAVGLFIILLGVRLTMMGERLRRDSY